MDIVKNPIGVGILTVSDTRTPTKMAGNETFDSSGHGVRELIEVSNVIESGRVVAYDCVPDDIAIIQAKMIEWCSRGNVDVLLSIGGTGFSPRDVTPEATLGLIQKQTPGITNAIMNGSLKITPMAMLSRGVSGIFEKTLIINLPGSEKAAKECLQVVACTIPHAISLIRDEKEISKNFHANLSSQDDKTKTPDCVTKIACRLRESPFPKISMESALSILKEHSCVQYDKNNKLRFPSVWIFSTGDELANDNKRHGSIIDTNTLMIVQILEQDNYKGQVLSSDIVKDNWEDLCKHFEKAFDNADIVVTTGGVSMGEKDFIKHVLTKHFNSEIHFGRVNMKPGMPTTFATLFFKGKKKYVFSLPGNPVSAGVCTHLFLLPYLRSVSGKRKILYNFKAKLTHSIDGLDVRPEYKRALMKYENGEFLVSILTKNQQSSRLLSFFGSNCLLQLPSSTEKINIEANTIMDVILIKSIENTYIAPVLEEKYWNVTLLKTSDCENAMNQRIKPELIQSSCLSIKEILDLLENMFRLKTKSVDASSAMGHVVELEIYSSENLPSFPSSIKDGYAIKYVDTDSWSQRGNVFKVVEVSVAGTAPSHQKEIKEGECARISTGAPVPPGANCVVQVEDTSVMSKSSDGTSEMEIAVLKEPKAFDNIRPIGSDISEGQCLVEQRTELGPFEIAYIRSVSCCSLDVYEYPTVRIIPYKKYSLNGTSKIIKDILELHGFKEEVFTYPVCQQLSDISLQYQHINYANDVIIICAENDTHLAFETIGNVEIHFHVKYETISFGFGTLHINKNQLIFFHTTSCDQDYIYTCMNLFVLPFLRFTSGRKQRISTVKAKCNTSYDLPIDKFEKSELRYEENDFEVTCYTSNRPNCLVKMPLLTESFDLSKAKTNLDVIITENSESYFIHY